MWHPLKGLRAAIRRSGQMIGPTTVDIVSQVVQLVTTGRKVNQLNRDIAELLKVTSVMRSEISDLSRKVDRLCDDNGQRSPRPKKSKKKEMVIDIHGNEVSFNRSVGGMRPIMATKDGLSSNFNVRRCRVWGCTGLNEKNGYCAKHAPGKTASAKKVRQIDPQKKRTSTEP